ncbi:MAG: glycosyltransferase family 2 protein [Clostridium sp.]
MKISIICPLYNGEKYIKSLHNSLLKQKQIESFEIRYILTDTNDKSEDILKELNAIYHKIKPIEFSHSLTRENEIYKSEGEVIVFITQDIIIKDDEWLNKLTKDILKGYCEASFARQICDNNSIEKYTRMNNYPSESRIVSKNDIQRLGIMTYFYSDAASAIKREVFIKLNGYDKKDLLTNEDMYIAYKLINSGYRIKYCGDAEVVHSHEYSFSSLFKRYFDQGVFLKQHEYIESSGAGNSALELALFVFKNAIKEINIKVLLNMIPNFGVRFVANKIGHRYENMSEESILRCSANKNYWHNNLKK